MIKKITQQNLILSLFENLVRSNLYSFIFFRFVTNKFFARLIYETDFKFIHYVRNLNFFRNKTILDIGANDGISIKAIRKFANNKIISFEPNKKNFSKIINLSKKIKKIQAYNVALSNKKLNKVSIYEAYYKKYHLSPFDSLSKKNVIKHLKDSLFIKKIDKQIIIKSSTIRLRKLDEFKLSPSFIKIDIQGHEYECVLGSLQTIKKNKPIIMIEFDNKIIKKIFNKLKKYEYKKFFYIANKKKLYEHKNEKVFNVFFIHNSLINKIKKNINIKLIDDNY